MLDESGQSLRFSKGLLAATLENIDPGVSVVDRDLGLVAWNSRYLELFDYPPGLVHVGAPVAGLIRFNAERGECGPGEVDAHVERRLEHMRRGHAHSFERDRADGKVLKTVGGPMPGGGYVMCLTDVTGEKRALRALEVANEQLKVRVEDRTRELRAARQVAEDATRDKTRFLAAASHDLLQPQHAARLFCAALDGGVDAAAQPLVANIDRSIGAADRLLRTLLDISKLDSGGVRATPEVFDVAPLIDELASEFAGQAAEKGLRLRAVADSGAAAFTDRTLLRSILQNFLANAVRYTGAGGVLIGCRRRGDRLRIEVWDTGTGIPAAQHAAVFKEFHRLTPGTAGDAGVGLGLAIVERTARLLGAPLDLRSRVGHGSMFAVEVMAAALPVATAPRPAVVPPQVGGLHVLCVDDDPMILAGLTAMLQAWGCTTLTAGSYALAVKATARSRFDAAFVDYHLGGKRTGLDLLASLRERFPTMRLALVTADPSPVVAAAAKALGAAVLRKPADPADLREALRSSVPAGGAAIAAE